MIVLSVLPYDRFDPCFSDADGNVKISDAENIVTSVTQCEQTTVTSFIQEKWKEYRSSATKDAEKNENVFYAEWIRNFYYVHLQVFLEEHNHSTQKQKAIISLLNLTEAGSDVVTKIYDFANWIGYLTY